MTTTDWDADLRRIDPRRIIGEVFRIYREQAGVLLPVVLTLILISLLAGVATVVGFIALVIPGLYLMTIWAVVAPVVVVERPGGLDAFGRSRALVRGHGWQVFGVIVMVIVLVLAVAIAAGILIASVGDAGGAVAGWVLSVVAAPVSALAAAVLYFALRVAHGEPARPEDAVEWMPPVAPA